LEYKQTYTYSENSDLLLRDKERRHACRKLHRSTDEVVDIHVAIQLSGTERQSVVNQCHYHPAMTHGIATVDNAHINVTVP